MLLSPAGGAEQGPVDEWTERARKVQPRLARGETVRVAVAANLAEAELLQNILLEEGIPSILRRSGGFDVPDFLAAGPRDVLVPVSGAAAARELLNPGGAPPDPEPVDPRGAAFRLAAAMLVCLLLFSALVALIWVLIG
ncbi:MAG: hypothetical protein R2691_06155 [Solirubrobacterales bacterium]